MKPRWKILLAAVVIGVIAVVILMPSRSYRRDLEAYKRDLHAKGEKITLAELFPPCSAANMSPGATLFMAITNIAIGTNFPVRFTAGQTNLTSAEFSNYQANMHVVALLGAALAAGPLDFNLDYSQSAGILLPHLTRFKRATQYAVGTTAQALTLKDYPEAWADLLVTVDLLRQWQGEPLLISDLVRAADFNVSVPVMIDALDERAWTDAQLAELQTWWEGMDLFTNAERTFAMEFAMTVDVMQQVRHDPGQLAMNYGVQGPGSAGGFNPPAGGLAREVYAIFWRLRMSGWRNTWSYEEELRYLQLIFAAKEVARKVAKTGAFVPAYEELAAQFTNINNMHANASNHFVLFQAGGEAAFSKYLTRLADAEAYRRVVVTAIALERYRLARGSYPARLEDLTPDLMTKVPIDLMDGKPLRYRLLSGGDYLLYTVGLDGQDDGGRNDHVWPRPAIRNEKAHLTPTNSPAK